MQEFSRDLFSSLFILFCCFQSVFLFWYLGGGGCGSVHKSNHYTLHKVLQKFSVTFRVNLTSWVGLPTPILIRPMSSPSSIPSPQIIEILAIVINWTNHVLSGFCVLENATGFAQSTLSSPSLPTEFKIFSQSSVHISIMGCINFYCIYLFTHLFEFLKTDTLFIYPVELRVILCA